MEISVRFASEDDIPEILRFIRALAEHQRMENEVTATAEQLQGWLFRHKMAEVLLAEQAGKAVGFALFFHTFLAFPAQPGLYLQDLYVDPDCRGTGCGKALLCALARIAAERGCKSVEWVCLDWNESGIRFYRSLGAAPVEGWITFRLSGDALHSLSEGAPAART